MLDYDITILLLLVSLSTTESLTIVQLEYNGE